MKKLFTSLKDVLVEYMDEEIYEAWQSTPDSVKYDAMIQVQIMKTLNDIRDLLVEIKEGD